VCIFVNINQQMAKCVSTRAIALLKDIYIILLCTIDYHDTFIGVLYEDAFGA